MKIYLLIYKGAVYSYFDEKEADLAAKWYNVGLIKRVTVEI